MIIDNTNANAWEMKPYVAMVRTNIYIICVCHIHIQCTVCVDPLLCWAGVILVQCIMSVSVSSTLYTYNLSLEHLISRVALDVLHDMV